MKKKILSVLMASVLAIGSLAGSAFAEEAAESAVPEAKYYYSFDEADGTEGIVPTVQDKTATPILSASDKKQITFIQGVKGEAVYSDGTYGLRLADVNGVGDTYTVAFWVYAKRFSNYMPTAQFGPDVHGDATGNQHYLNITRAEWSAEGATFPSIWSYDQATGLWPAWDAEGGVQKGMNEWVHIALAVDPAETITDGSMINAKLYVNGERWHEYDADGNEIEYPVVFGTMDPSDNFDFLLGVNYWDSIFKGAFDELYIFDTALTDEQVLALYQEGDPTVEFVEPERQIIVEQHEDAIAQIGSPDLDNGFWTDWSEAFELKDGDHKRVVLSNYSDGAETWDNFVVVLTNEYSEDGADPNAASDSHKEYAAVRADLYGWLNGDGAQVIPEEAYNWSWDNWTNWQTKVMTDAQIELIIAREGTAFSISYTATDYNGSTHTGSADFELEIAAEDPCYFLFTNEHCYNEILSVDDAIIVAKSEESIDSVGSVNLDGGFWTDFSEPLELKDGETRKMHFMNYSDGAENWHNFVYVFTNEYTEPHQNPNADGAGSENHVEWAAVRADAYGWGNNYEATYETSWGDNWTAWLDAMKAADVVSEITRNGGEITILLTITDRKGEEYTSTTKFTCDLTAEDPCFVLFTNEMCFNDILSVE